MVGVKEEVVMVVDWVVVEKEEVVTGDDWVVEEKEEVAMVVG